MKLGRPVLNLAHGSARLARAFLSKSQQNYSYPHTHTHAHTHTLAHSRHRIFFVMFLPSIKVALLLFVFFVVFELLLSVFLLYLNLFLLYFNLLLDLK